MANYDNLKGAIQNVITDNGNQEITGNVLQSVLLSMIDNIGANATFSGVATPTTAPGTPDQLVFYIAGQPGTYSNFGGSELNNGELAVFSNPNGAWKTEKIALFRSYDAEKILALTTSSSSDDIKAAFTPIGGSEVDFPRVGDYIISQSQQAFKDKPKSVVAESTETVLRGKRIAFLANRINYAITIVFDVSGTYNISSISKAEIGADTDTANASGSVYGRIAKNAEDIKNLQDEPSLHDLWLQAGATYQKDTNTYTLNGLAGLTKDDMLNCWINRFSTGDIDTFKFAYREFKTNFPVGSSDKKANLTRYAIVFDYTFYLCSNSVVIKVSEQRNDLYGLIIKDSATSAFSGCVNLRTIIGQIICANKITFGAYCFSYCSKLMDVRIAELRGDISFADSPLLTVKDSTDSSLGYMVENAANTEPITITLHPDAFIRLEESLIQKAQAKQISIVSA